MSHYFLGHLQIEMGLLLPQDSQWVQLYGNLRVATMAENNLIRWIAWGLCSPA